MLTVLARNWGWIALRGAAGIAFGLLTLFNPAISLAVLILLFAVYSLADGLFTAIAAVVNRQDEPFWVSFLISGLLGIAIGVVTFLWPGVTAIALVLLIGAWAIVLGVGEIFAAIRLRKLITGEWLLLLTGAISVLFGILVFAFPAGGALAIVLWIGAFAIVIGVLRLALALRLRRWRHGREGWIE